MTPEILEILYIAAIAIGSFIGFCATIWGIYWKVAQVRKGDLAKTDSDISKAKAAGVDAAAEVQKETKDTFDKIWTESRRIRTETEAELERKTDQLHKRLEDEKRERHAEEVKQSRDIGRLEGTVETMMKIFVNKDA